MQNNDYSTYILVRQSPGEAFNAVLDVTSWWTEDAVGDSDQLEGQFEAHFGDGYFSKQRLVEFVPDQKIVWIVVDSHLEFATEKDDWVGTKICFEISEVNDR